MIPATAKPRARLLSGNKNFTQNTVRFIPSLKSRKIRGELYALLFGAMATGLLIYESTKPNPSDIVRGLLLTAAGTAIGVKIDPATIGGNKSE